MTVIFVGLLAFSGSTVVGLLRGIPEPAIHDEFSYLLAADTFAHGRLTNPTHPMWMHFESFHIIQQPSYMSKYPPAQGLILAAGQVIVSHPIAGVWLSFALMCAAITWMLYAWVSPCWALLGGLMAIIHPQLGVAGYWAQSYWGGAVAATGGALVMGALRRIIRQSRARDSFVMGIGLVVLANSRPYEGLLISLPAAVALFVWMIGKHGPSFRMALARVVLPLVALLAFAATVMGFYNLRITSNVFLMPYQAYEATYARAPLFIWQPARPDIPINHQVMRDFDNANLQYYSKQDLNLGIGIRILFTLLWVFRSGDVFLIPLIAMFSVMASWVLKNHWAIFALTVYIVMFSGLFMETYVNMHYTAPIMVFNYFFVVKSMQLWLWRNKTVGRYALWCIPLLGVVSLVWTLHRSLRQEGSTAWHIQRARIVERLSKEGGRHLMIVTYGPRHSAEKEWVYNDADIDHAKIVWARSMDVTQNCKLLTYFKGRRIWSLEVDNDESLHNPEPYPVSQCP